MLLSHCVEHILVLALLIFKDMFRKCLLSDNVDYVIQADVAELQRQLMSMVDGQPEEL